MNFERRLGNDRGKPVSLIEFPAVNQAVVAGGASEVTAEKGLPHRLGELHFDHLPGAHSSPPLDAPAETFAVRCGRDKVAHKLVERLVRLERVVEPVGDLLAATVDIAGAGVVVSQQ